MLKALELLSLGNLSIKEIAYNCGYNDEKYFNRPVSCFQPEGKK